MTTPYFITYGVLFFNSFALKIGAMIIMGSKYRAKQGYVMVTEYFSKENASKADSKKLTTNSIMHV